MMSASPVAVMAGAVDPDMVDAAGVADAVSSAEYFDVAASDADLDLTHVSDAQLDESGEAESAVAPRELVIVDTALEDYETLLNDLLATSDNDSQIVVHILDSNQDGVDQITELLSEHQDLEAVHLLTHGTEGRVKLGDTWLSSDNLSGYASDIAVWGEALTADGDLLFYGCDIAAGPDGEMFVDAVAALSGADVAASIDGTGNSLYGGDWDFEYTVGAVEAAVIVSAEAQLDWDGLLAVINVTTTSDVVDGDVGSVAALIADPGADGFISLREAILAANQNVSADDIFLAAGTYSVLAGGGGDNGGDFDIKGDLSIAGIDAASTIIDGGAIERVLEIHSGIVTISDLTVQNGNDGDGGGIHVKNGADLALLDVAVTGNTSSGKGGGIYDDGTLNLERVAIYGNNAADGAGVYANGGPTTTLINATISGNTATSKGGGILAKSLVNLTNVTVANNSAPTGGGIYDDGGTAQLRNVILNNNTGGDANLLLTSLGYNIDSDGTALTGAAAGDQAGVDAMLGTLQINGGSTVTHALLAGSTAIDNGTANSAPALDQRGELRGASVDIGAYELTNTAPTTAGIGDVIVSEDSSDSVVDLFAAFGDAQDADNAMTYSVTSNTNPGLFTSTSINAVAGTLTLDYAPDANGSANITVRATDTGGLYVETTFAVSVGAVNDAPVNSLPVSQTIAEDTPLVFSAGNGNAVTVTDVDAGSGTIQVTLTATNGTITMPSMTGLVLSVGTGTADSTTVFSGTVANINAALDGLTFTPTGGYSGTGSLSVLTDDLGNTGSGTNLTDSDSVDITITSVNDPPTTSGVLDITVSEDAADSVIDLFAAFADEEDADSALTYSIMVSTNPGLFNSSAIDGVAGTLTLDYAADANGSGDVTLRATDTGGQWVETTFTVTVNPVNDLPTTAGIGDVIVAEDAADTVVDLFAAFGDVEDLDPALTYTITSNTNTGLFNSTAVDGVAGSLTLDYAADVYGSSNVTVRATDSGGLFVETTFAVTVTAVNDQPTTAGIGDVIVAEDAVDTVLDLFAAFGDVEDPDNALTYSITSNTNSGLFSTTTVDGVAGSLTLDYAADAFGSSNITVRATDTGGLFVETTFAVTVNAVNDPVTTSGIGDVIVSEDAADTVVDLFAAFADVEDADNALTYNIMSNTNPALFSSSAIDGVAGTLTLDYAADAFGSTNITVRATDGGGAFVDTAFTVTVNPVNDLPTTAGIGDVIVAEDAADTVVDLFAAFGDVEDLDPALTYTITSNTNAGLFNSTAVDGVAGSLTLDYAADTFGSADITVRATDSGGLFVETTFAVTVNAVNDQPTTSGLGNVTVSEDAADTVLDLFSAFADVEDLDSALAYSITGNTNPGLFSLTTINGGVGTLTLDYAPDAFGASNITVRATDTGGQFVETTFTVTVNPVNDQPTTSGIGDVTVSEDAVDSVVDLFAGFADTEDPDNALTYSVLSNSNPSLFDSTSVSGGAGTLTLDYAADANGSASITVRATDSGGMFVDTTFTVTVLPVNDQPTTIGLGDVTVAEDAADSLVGLFAAFGDVEDADPSLTYTYTKTNPALFDDVAVDGVAGTLTLDYAADAHGTSDVTVRATDTGGSFVETTFTVNVTPVNDQPVSTDDNYTVSNAATLVIAPNGVMVNDADVDGDAMTPALVSGPASGTLTMNPDGSFTYTPDPSYVGQVTFAYRVNDGTVNGNVATVTIDVQPVPMPVMIPTKVPPPTSEPSPNEPGPDSETLEPGSDDAPPPPAHGHGHHHGAHGRRADHSSGHDESHSRHVKHAAGSGHDSDDSSFGESVTAGRAEFDPHSFFNRSGSHGGRMSPFGFRSFDRAMENAADFVTGGLGGMDFTSVFSPLMNELDEMRNELTFDTHFEHIVAGTAATVTTGFTVGYVMWLVRGGYLVTSLLAQMPAWKLVDPLPILDCLDQLPTNVADDDDLGSLVQRGMDMVSSRSA